MTTTVRLDVGYEESEGGVGPMVSFMVDGRDLREALYGETAGSDPIYIGLSAHDLVMQPGIREPSEIPTAVRLYRCTCGEVGCDETVARSYRSGRLIAWDSFDGVPTWTDPLFLDDAIVFDADQYHRAIDAVVGFARVEIRRPPPSLTLVANLRIKVTEATEAAGVAGLPGTYLGPILPELMEVEIVGGPAEEAVGLYVEELDEVIWIDPRLVGPLDPEGEPTGSASLDDAGATQNVIFTILSRLIDMLRG